MGRVADWPRYLLGGISQETRQLLSEEAAARDVSVADVIRSLLCDHYGLECLPESYGYDPRRDRHARTFLLRLQPRLARLLERDAARTARTKRRIILEAIEAHYAKGEQ